jgi:hypothetical protein
MKLEADPSFAIGLQANSGVEQLRLLSAVCKLGGKA